MTIFETVKAAVTVRQAAEHYGLEVNRNGMTCCPFHKDRHPSMKIYDDHFYCFGCGATGDVIDFTAQLFGISMVSSIISAMVNGPKFAEAIQAKIGTAVNTDDMEKERDALCAQLRQAVGTKTRLEQQMDALDVTDAHYEKKILDLQRRYDAQYDVIADVETQIEDVETQIQSIRQEKISADNIYRLLLAFDELYQSATEIERKEFMRAFIEKIEIYPEKRKDGCWVKKIVFNFPVPVNGEDVIEYSLESLTTVETVCLLSKLSDAKHHVEVELNLDEMDVTSAESKATYDEIRDYVMKQIGLHVTNLNIAQIKRKCGIIERENYNLPKNEDSRQPSCTKEKEEAIKKAFRRFGMI